MSSAPVIAALLLLNLTVATGQSSDPGSRSRLTSVFRSYRPSHVVPVRFTDSDRLRSLVRAGHLYLSLKDAIALALENNLDVEVQRYAIQLADAALLRTQAGGALRGVPTSVQSGVVSSQVLGSSSITSGSGGIESGGAIITTTGTSIPVLDPEFYLGYNWRHYSRPQANTVTTGLTAVELENSNFDSGIRKQFLTGTRVDLSWNSQASLSNSPGGDLNPFNDVNAGLTISQPLLKGFGIAVNNREIRRARNQQRIVDLTFEQQVIETSASIIRLYLDLVSFHADLAVREEALALAERFYSDTQKRVSIGAESRIEIETARAEVINRRRQLSGSRARLRQQENILKNELSRGGAAHTFLAGVPIVPTSTIPKPDPDGLATLSQLSETALAERPEVRQMEIQIANTQISMKGTQSRLKPSFDVWMQLRNNGLAGNLNELRPPDNPPSVDAFFIGGYGLAAEQVLRRNFPDYGFGFELSIPVRNRSARADHLMNALQLRQQQIRQRRQADDILLRVRNSLVALEEARLTYELALEERSLKERVFEAEQMRYVLGASQAYFVIRYQRELAESQADEVMALAVYAKAEVDVQRESGQLLGVYGIRVDEAREGRVRAPPVQQ